MQRALLMVAALAATALVGCTASDHNHHHGHSHAAYHGGPNQGSGSMVGEMQGAEPAYGQLDEGAEAGQTW